MVKVYNDYCIDNLNIYIILMNIDLNEKSFCSFFKTL